MESKERNEAADNDAATATDLTSETGMDRLRSLFTIRYLLDLSNALQEKGRIVVVLQAYILGLDLSNVDLITVPVEGHNIKGSYQYHVLHASLSMRRN